jgi:hypothetical protein
MWQVMCSCEVRTGFLYSLEVYLCSEIVSVDSRVEAGLNTSAVALRAVGGDKKGSLESETVKYGRDLHGTRTQEWMRWRGPAAVVNDRPILSSERMLYKDYDHRCSNEMK